MKNGNYQTDPSLRAGDRGINAPAVLTGAVPLATMSVSHGVPRTGQARAGRSGPSFRQTLPPAT
ncbi:hypothetical protein ACOMQZ_002065 [Enterobacter quasiroggenkampii]